MNEFVHAKVEIDETAATIAADREYIAAGVGAIKSARAQIERKIRKDRFFLTTLEPYEPDVSDEAVVKRMCAASKLAEVGPMATVAGVVAQEALEAMVSAGCGHGWVDNGGDVALVLKDSITMEVFADLSSGKSFAMELEPTSGTLGICSSSGKLGHSISFGNADVALVIAEDAVLADALATALGNRVQDKSSLKTCFEGLGGIKGMIGGLVMLDGAVAMHGKVPKLVEADHNPERLTIHSKMSAERFVGPQGGIAGVKT